MDELGFRETFSFIVEDAKDDGQRVDVYLHRMIPDVSRSLIQKLIRDSCLQINDRMVVQANARLSVHDRVEFAYREPVCLDLQPQKVEFEILFEDRELIVINKPAGLLVHPGAGRREPTLVEGVLYHLNGKHGFDSEQIQSGRPGIVHRLDADTSGVMVVAKNAHALAVLAEQFQKKTNLRVYKALLVGALKEADYTVKAYIGRDSKHRTAFTCVSEEEFDALKKGRGHSVIRQYRYSESFFKRERVYKNSVTLSSCRLATGRTHQIRVHARYINHSVVGDPVYCSDLSGITDERVKVAVRGLGRQMLHAETLGFEHPKTRQKLAFQADPPQDFRELLVFLESLK